MAEYLNNINTILIYIFLILCIAIKVKSKEEYIPALIWTSQGFQVKKNIDYLVKKKIKSDLFEAYLMELLIGQKALIVVFLEHDLNVKDFAQTHRSGENYPFLNNLTVHTAVDYLRSVESPYRTIVQLFKGYKLKYFKPGGKFNFNVKDLVLVEFEEIKTERFETIRNHSQQIQELNRQLTELEKNWVCIYTARQSHKSRVNPWLVKEMPQEKSTKTISLYRDEYTGFTLMTKSSIQLYLPFKKSLAVKILDNYLGASVKSSRFKLDFVIWFLNYTLTLRLNQTQKDWKIQEAKLLNGNGDTLTLSLAQEDLQEKNNCYICLTELKSEGKPLVKIILYKYKFVKLKLAEEPCKKPYGFQITFFVIILSLVTAVMCWNKMLDKFDFSENPSVIRIPIENLLPMSYKPII